MSYSTEYYKYMYDSFAKDLAYVGIVVRQTKGYEKPVYIYWCFITHALVVCTREKNVKTILFNMAAEAYADKCIEYTNMLLDIIPVGYEEKHKQLVQRIRMVNEFKVEILNYDESCDDLPY